MSNRKFKVWKGDSKGGELKDYSIDVDKGMVVLDIVHSIQKLHDSDFHIALQISYPNKWDKRKAKINSHNPGGLIMIHGQSKNLELNTEDWTNGCIAVTNEEIEEINKLVELKTPVYISK